MSALLVDLLAGLILDSQIEIITLPNSVAVLKFNLDHSHFTFRILYNSVAISS